MESASDKTTTGIVQPEAWAPPAAEYTPAQKQGFEGERDLFNLICSRTKNIPGRRLIPDDSLYIPDKTNQWTEIDLIMIHQSGIYVFENKQYQGWVSGGMNDRLWLHTNPYLFSSGQTRSFHNPVLQNRRHIEVAAKYLGLPEYMFTSVIVFNDECDISRLPKNTPGTFIRSRSQVMDVLQSLMLRDFVFEPDRIDEIYRKLQKNTRTNGKVIRQHLEGVKEGKKRRSEQRKKKNGKTKRSSFTDY
mgnify:CR=1 FL=1